MKIVILSCPTGEGHNSAARAIQEELNRRGVESRILDPLTFLGEKTLRVVSSVYNNLIRRMPGAFGAVYKAGALYDETGLRSPVYGANAVYASNLYTYLQRERVDAVICTHLFGMEALTALRRRVGCAIPCYGVLTDYTVIPFLAETRMDGYFVPDKSVGQDLAGRGVPEEHIFPVGIPVSEQVMHRVEAAEARRQLGLPAQKKIYLVMSGGVGCENMLKLCDRLVEDGGTGTFVCLLTGKNESMRAQIASRYSAMAVSAVSFTQQVPLYMNACDVLLSKPGGLSSTEAAVANIPFVCVHAIPGCETYNAAFFAEQGMALHAYSDQEAVCFARLLAFNERRAEEMRLAQRRGVGAFAARDIASRVMEGNDCACAAGQNGCAQGQTGVACKGC